jgi:hypothetical protein
LPAGLRAPMEARLGASFSDVRLHTDNGAARVAAQANARALTIGSDIYFAPGAFAPRTVEGGQHDSRTSWCTSSSSVTGSRAVRIRRRVTRRGRHEHWARRRRPEPM